MRLWSYALLIAAAVFVVSAVAGAAAPEQARTYRLVLTDGTTRDVRGPVERRDGQILFRNARGWLVSLRESDVTAIRPLTGTDATAPAAGDLPAAGRPSKPERAPADEGPAIRYTNADLPPGPAGDGPESVAGPATERPVPGGDSGGEADPLDPAPVEPAGSASAEPLAELSAPALVETPGEAGGHSEGWWRDEIGRLRDEIDELERQENTTHRLWVCAMSGVPIDGDECRPKINQLPPANAVPRTPLQRSLAEQLRGIRAAKDGRRADLQRFIDEAIAVGVPTAWLLPGS